GNPRSKRGRPGDGGAEQGSPASSSTVSQATSTIGAGSAASAHRPLDWSLPCTARMCALTAPLPVVKNPPHRSRTAHASHSGRYSFFQSLIDFTVKRQTAGSVTQSWWL